MRDVRKIGVVGLGAMGGPMARNLAKAEDIELVVFDLNPAAAAAMRDAAQIASSLEDLVAQCDAVFTILPADSHVEAVSSQIVAAGRPGQILVDFSTISPVTIEHVARDAARAGLVAVSAALMRGVAAAEAGTLSLFVGGEDAAIRAVSSPLRYLARDISEVGSVGAAKVLKIVNNLIVSSLDVSICDLLVLAAKAGVPAADAVHAMQQGEGASWAIENHIAKNLLSGELGPGIFSTDYMAKDVTLAVAVAMQKQVPAAFGGLVLSYYRGAAAAGHRHDYHPVVIRWLEAGAKISAVTGPSGDVASATDVTAVLAEALTVLQTLICLEGLRIAQSAGVEWGAAAGFLQAGSARNGGLASVGGGTGIASGLGFMDMARMVAGAVDRARALDVPAMSLALAQHCALGLVDRYGATATVRDVLEASEARA